MVCPQCPRLREVGSYENAHTRAQHLHFLRAQKLAGADARSGRLRAVGALHDVGGGPRGLEAAEEAAALLKSLGARGGQQLYQRRPQTDCKNTMMHYAGEHAAR